jgi:hypothetical protein
MDFRSDEEEERWVRQNARRMPVVPDRLAERLKPQDWVLIFADREMGVNEIRLVRPARGLKGLFDFVEVKSNIRGAGAAINIELSPFLNDFCYTEAQEHVSAARYGYAREYADFKSPGASKLFEERVAAALPRIFDELHAAHGAELARKSASARQAAERYLRELRASDDLHETYARLRKTASPEQLEQADRYLRRESIHTYNLVDFRIVSEIAALCQILWWDRPQPPKPMNGWAEGDVWNGDNPDDYEAYARFHLVASRLAREPPWPIVDPLVPNRRDQEEAIPWRDGKPSATADAVDEFLASADRRCACGKVLFYLRHAVRKGAGSPLIELTVRCNNGHEQRVEFDAAALAQGTRFAPLGDSS